MSKTFEQWWDSSESQAFGWRHKDVAEAAWTAGQRANHLFFDVEDVHVIGEP